MATHVLDVAVNNLINVMSIMLQFIMNIQTGTKELYLVLLPSPVTTMCARIAPNTEHIKLVHTEPTGIIQGDEQASQPQSSNGPRKN